MKNKSRTAQKLEMIPNKRAFTVITALLVVVTVFHYFTGSRDWEVHDFFRRLYYIPIIIAAFKFRLKGALVVSIATVILYAPHLLVYFGAFNIELVNQFLEAGMFVVLGLITGYLVEEDYKARRVLEGQIVKISNLEKYTTNLLNSIDSGVVAFGKEGNLQSMNKEARRIFDTPEQTHRFLRQNHLKKALMQTIATGKVHTEKKLTRTTPGGNRVFLEVTLFPVRDVSERIEGAVLVAEDITLVTELEEQVRRGERLAAIGELSSGVAHEIRNPLGIIKTISQSLQEEDPPEEVQQGLEIIEQEIQRANKVVEGLLDFAKPGKYNMENLPLAALLEELVLMTRKLAEQKGVTVSFQPPKQDYLVKGDRDKLKQGFLNVILNGIQAMEEKSAKEEDPGQGVMTIRLEEMEEASSEPHRRVKVIIEDQGGGIAPENINKIYDPFFTTKDQGTGLGLSVTHRIIEEHRGRLEIKSEEGKGSRVTIELPGNSRKGEESG